MLRLHFINVGDGDAALIEEDHQGAVYRLLVDTGRADPGAVPGSRRRTAAAYLREHGVTRLDALVVTHLHEDHFGGTAEVLEQASVETVYAGFFPCPPVQRMARTGAEEKTVRGLLDCLEQWSDCAALFRARGCRLRQIEKTISLSLTPRVQGEIICDDPPASARQRRVWTEMLSGGTADPDQVWWSSKFRNPGSLRVRLRYAGRRIELAGDCYGAVWEDRAEPCDIWKVPHHGDAKSVTPELVRRLRPAHAVVSCSPEYIARKDRPSRRAAELLEERGCRVWSTGGFPWAGQEADRWPSVDFTVMEDGTILSPREE